MLACLLLAVGLPIDPRRGALQEHAHQMMPDVDLLNIASSGRPVRDASCRAVGALDGRALQLHPTKLLVVPVLLPTALLTRLVQRLLVSRMAAWEAVDALERSRPGRHRKRAYPGWAEAQGRGRGLEQERERWPEERERWREADEQVELSGQRRWVGPRNGPAP